MPDKSFHYVDIGSVSNEQFQITEAREILGRSAPSRARKLIRHGDVIFATTRPYLRSIAQVPPELDGQICSTGFCVLRPTHQVISDWLFYSVLSRDFLAQITSRMRGASYPAVSDRDVLEAKIPVPSPAEQYRIVVRIKDCTERIEEMERLGQESLLDAEAVLPSVLNEVFESVSKSAPLRTIGELVTETRYGTSQKCHSQQGGTPVLRIPNVAEGAVNFSDLKYCDISAEELERIRLVDGDLLFVRTNGSRDLVGRCAVFEATSPDNAFAFASYLIRVRLDRTRILPKYLSYFLNSTKGRAEINRRRRTSAGQFNINSENLRTIPVPVPPVETQKDLLRVLAERESHANQLVDEIHAVIAESVFIRESLLRKAFAGEL